MKAFIDNMNSLSIFGVDTERLIGLNSYQDFENAMLSDKNFNSKISGFFLHYYNGLLDVELNSFGEILEEWFNTYMTTPKDKDLKFW